VLTPWAHPWCATKARLPILPQEWLPPPGVASARARIKSHVGGNSKRD
jgi:hypothetical protein